MYLCKNEFTVYKYPNLYSDPLSAASLHHKPLSRSLQVLQSLQSNGEDNMTLWRLMEQPDSSYLIVHLCTTPCPPVTIMEKMGRVRIPFLQHLFLKHHINLRVPGDSRRERKLDIDL